MYFNGSGVEKDKKKAYKLFNMAASLGSEDACFFLGYSYLGGELIDEKNSVGFTSSPIEFFLCLDVIIPLTSCAFRLLTETVC